MRRVLGQRDLSAKSPRLLEVTKRQSVRIDEARVLRRLRDMPRKDRAEAIARTGAPANPRELMQEIDQEVSRGQTLLASLCDGPPWPGCRTAGSKAAGPEAHDRTRAQRLTRGLSPAGTTDGGAVASVLP